MCVAVKVDGDVVYRAWMVVHEMVQRMKYHNNRCGTYRCMACHLFMAWGEGSGGVMLSW